ncbi:hypothetical protein [Helicobacter sp. MIT 14-3879]|uniref:hypothetical protein n=1 Tax=Helicobacter sp. MIT 14-3879 TaxID=2040649 RepID=UPI000E1E79EC|nr:hypothetical protein [Helicobacter sp. MIT 14-3879]RDU59414.1 hypothetical protein CQA44_11470 [Helicobacter sp. MIT 14-3879]
MKTSDKIALIYLIICVLIAGFFAMLGYGLNGTGSDMPKAVVYFCLYMIWLLVPYTIISLVIEMIKSFRMWKLINLILMLFFTLVYYIKFF